MKKMIMFAVAAFLTAGAFAQTTNPVNDRGQDMKDIRKDIREVRKDKRQRREELREGDIQGAKALTREGEKPRGL